MTPSARSTRHLRELGYHVATVERWIPGAMIRNDAFEWGDLLTVHPRHEGAVLIQTTTNSHAGNRLAKAKGNPALISWLTARNRLILHGWRKLKGRWTVAERELILQDVLVEDRAAPPP